MASDYECPGCGTALRATNLEYWYPDETGGVMSGTVTPESLRPFSDHDAGDGEQAWHCPTPPDECPVLRVLPGGGDGG